MKEYNIQISPAAERDFKELKSKLKNFSGLIGAIDELSTNLRPSGVRKILLKLFIFNFK